MRVWSWAISVVLSILILVSLPSVQGVFVAMPGEMDRLIAESRAKDPVGPPVHPDLVYSRRLFRTNRLDIYEPLAAGNAGEHRASTPDPDGKPAGPDVELADSDRRPPVVVFFHGGSWIHGDKITIRVVDRFLRRMREAGYFVIAVNYTDSVFRGLTGPVENARRAILWIADHAEDYGYDPNRLGLWGVSAGGHLALMAASTMEQGDFRFSFVFAECAPSDLVALRDGEAFENSRSLRIFPGRRLAELSPVRHVHPGLPPALLFHGGEDRVVDIRQSERYAEAVRAAGVPVQFNRYPDGDHGFFNIPEQWYEQETAALRYFSERFAARTD